MHLAVQFNPPPQITRVTLISAGPDDARFIPRDHEHPTSNLFDFTALGKEATLLDPAVGPRRK